jgi:hypothetical protein
VEQARTFLLASRFDVAMLCLQYLNGCVDLQPVVCVVRAIGFGTFFSDLCELCFFMPETDEVIDLKLSLDIYKNVSEADLAEAGFDKKSHNLGASCLCPEIFDLIVSWLNPVERPILFYQKQEFAILKNYCKKSGFCGVELFRPVFLSSQLLGGGAELKEADYYRLLGIKSEDKMPNVAQAKRRLALYQRLDGLSLSTRRDLLRIIHPDYLVSPSESREFMKIGRVPYMKEKEIAFRRVAEFSFRSYRVNATEMLCRCFPGNRLDESFDPMAVNEGRYEVIDTPKFGSFRDVSLSTIKKVGFPYEGDFSLGCGPLGEEHPTDYEEEITSK